MTETQYGIIEGKQPEFLVRKLLRVPHKNKDLIVAYPAFGPNYFSKNVEEMQKPYSHPITGERIYFREPTTSESISAASYDFENEAKPKIFDQRRHQRWLQAGRIVRTSEGVFVNPPKDEKGNSITDEKSLKSYLNKAKKVNGIYLHEKDFGFAPYESFKRGVQDCDTFADGGLARILEHTEEKTAKNLRAIASPKFYKKGVNIGGFDDVEEPTLRVVSLYSVRCLVGGRLGVVGDDWGGYDDGYAFGVVGGEADDSRKIF